MTMKLTKKNLIKEIRSVLFLRGMSSEEINISYAGLNELDMDELKELYKEEKENAERILGYELTKAWIQIN